MNPLLKKFNTAPFSEIKNEHFLPAIKKLIVETKAEIDQIVTNTEAPTFTNTVEALENTGQQLDRATSIFFNLNSAETSEEIQKIAQEVSPLLTEFSNDLLLNEALFKRVKAVYDNRSDFSLNTEQNTLLDKQYKSFSRNGANLSEEKKKQLRKLDTDLSKLKLTFGENVLAETNAYQMHLTEAEDLAGLPNGAKEAAKQAAEEKELEGWLITLDYPSYIPFMKYAEKRELRKELSLAFGARAFQTRLPNGTENKYNNEENVLKLVNLRHQRAKLLGYDSHAHFVLEERMAKTPQKVQSFLEELLEKAKPAAQKEFEELSAFAKELDGVDQLQKWDSAFYAEKLKQQKFNLDDEKLKPYFKLENVIDGVFMVAEKLFGIHFTIDNSIDKYHHDVKAYRVTDAEGAEVAIFYADFHPRPGKRQGAWMTSYKPQQKFHGINDRPHVSIVCNFTKPTPTTPSLLTFNEVTTLFHEFGHALHGMLANTTYKGLSGTNVYWDFVELPSQILENWCYEKETLELFAKHYKTDEIIPMELVEKIKESATFHEGMQTLRQISFGMLDMAWHGEDPSSIKNVKQFETKAFEGTQLFPETPETCMSTSFGHIFQGGYSSGYYSYKWAEVLDADAFAYFQEEGIFNKEVATKFKEFVLSQGGTQDPMELYVKFRGKKPDPEALLKRAGLLN
ncbi:M3 family metallopeptidase [Marinirhabdus gelatinilytica]|uniref:oligopeptidase A n=1 Tax=Marinirhabdus gelatinilytica TaxID=1703343 RepID=A0A370Q7D7_9FLAO|nr:M3 family metallopeptidase [Marinirhabdus gelatinilytica]RDK84264.1 peptidyl-dipeptidase Dcp [Marinirhabdus gelatinilytica]